MKRRELLKAAGAFAACAVTSPLPVRAQAWPTRDITIIVAVGPGSSADSVARGVAKVLSRELGVPVQVKNVLGGAGLTGFAELAASKADGSIIGLVNVGGLLVFPHVMTVPYTWDSFSFLGSVAENYFGIGIAANSPIKTVDDLIKLGKTRPITWSASAIMNGIAMVQLGTLTGAKFRFVPANTQPEAVAQAVGGHVDIVLQTPPDMVSLIEGKQLRLLASATANRWPNYPDVQTLKELGFNASSVVPLGFACPAAVPAELKARLEKAIIVAGKDPELLATMKQLTIMPNAMTGAEFLSALKAQAPVVDEVLSTAGMKKR